MTPRTASRSFRARDCAACCDLVLMAPATAHACSCTRLIVRDSPCDVREGHTAVAQKPPLEFVPTIAAYATIGGRFNDTVLHFSSSLGSRQG
jgi:hypothetical protein